MKRLPLIVFGIVLVMFVVAVFTRPPQQVAPVARVVPTQVLLPGNVPQTAIWMEPRPEALVTPQGTIPMVFFMRSKQNLITRVQLELSYDPTLLKYVDIKEEDYLGGKPILEKTVNEKTGRISFVVSLGPKDVPIQGTDSIAEVIFKPLVMNGVKTEVKMLPESAAMAVGSDKSVLTEATGTTVVLVKGNQKVDE